MYDALRRGDTLPRGLSADIGVLQLAEQWHCTPSAVLAEDDAWVELQGIWNAARAKHREYLESHAPKQ